MSPSPSGSTPAVGVRASLVYRLWGLLSAPISAALLVTVLTPSEQGEWYTLVGLQRFQAVVELGFGTTFLSVVAHARAPARLRDLLNLALRWHVGMGLAWGVGASLLGGWWLVSVGLSPRVWVGLCLSTALCMVFLPLQLWREGQGQVGEVFQLRLWQGVASRLASWAGVVAGFTTWGLVVERGVVMVASGAYAVRGWPPSQPSTERAFVIYTRDVFPLQWRVALSMVGGALPWAMLVPTTLASCGTEVAGRIGVGLAMLGALQSLCWSVLSPWFPGVAHARRDQQHPHARELLMRGLRPATLLFGVGTLGGLFLVVLIPTFGFTLSVLGPLPWLLLAAGGLFRLLREVVTAWTRADLTSPTWVVDVVEGVVFWPLLSWGAGWGEVGVAATFCLSACLALGGALWRVSR